MLVPTFRRTSKMLLLVRSNLRSGARRIDMYLGAKISINLILVGFLNIILCRR